MARDKESKSLPETSNVVEASETTEQPHIWLGPGNLLWQGETLQPGTVIPNYVPFDAEVEHKDE